jgi:hypothetical protein
MLMQTKIALAAAMVLDSSSQVEQIADERRRDCTEYLAG